MNRVQTAPVDWARRLGQVDPVSYVPSWPRAHGVAIAAVASVVLLGALVVVQVVTVGWDVWEWDALNLSGYVTVIVALWLARGQRRRFVSMVNQLHATRSLTFDLPDEAARDAARDDLVRVSEAEAAVWSNAGGLLIALVMAVSWPSVTSSYQPTVFVILGMLLAVPAGYIVGRQGGALWYYGYWGLTLRRRATIVPLQGHSDGAAGLRPLGSYFFSQAMLLAIPAAFLLVWSLLIPFWDDGRYDGWRPWYQGLLALTAAAEVMAFMAPLLGVRAQMIETKTRFLGSTAGEITLEIEKVRRQLEGDLDAGLRANLRDRLGHLTQAYRDIEEMPTWPIDTKIRNRLTLNYALLFLPLLGQWLDGNGNWQSLAEKIVE